MPTAPPYPRRSWISNRQVDFVNADPPSPMTIRVDISGGPFYAIGDLVRLIDMDPCGGYVLGKVTDMLKYPDRGCLAVVEWSREDIVYWDPQEM